MTCWVVIPIKAPDACKSRLAGVLADGARRDLAARMLHHVVEVASVASGVDQVLLLGPERHGLPLSMCMLGDPGRGLNAALGSAARVAAEARVDRLLFISADLPVLTPGDVAALIAVPADSAAIGPDRMGGGTNALSLPCRALPHFGFRYGVQSFPAHAREARRAGLGLRIIRSHTLAFDIDLPADLQALRDWPGASTGSMRRQRRAAASG